MGNESHPVFRIAVAMLVAAMPTMPARAQSTLDARSKTCITAALADARAALPVATAGAAAAQDVGDRNAESRFRRCEGYAHESLGDLGAAFAAYGAAVVAAEAGGDAEALADALAGRGEHLHASGEYDRAIADLKRAYDLYLAAGLGGSEDYVLNAMANLYADPNVGEYDKALGYYRELLARHQRDGQRGEVATATFNLGATLDSKHDYGQALAEYHRALALYQALGDQASIAETRRVIGATLAKQGRAGEAIGWIDQALAWYRKAGDDDGIARTALTRGIALRAAGRPADALRDLDAARVHFAAAANQRFLVRIDEERAKAFADLGRWREAYAALRLQFDAQHALDASLASEATSRLRVQFGTERTQQLNRALQAENASRGAALVAAARERRLQRLAILLGALSLCLLAVLVVRQLLRMRRLRELASTDDLTGIANRRGVFAFLRERLRLAARAGSPLAVVAFDIDHFKRINDLHGHDAGDRALRRVAALAVSAARASDRVGRIGGEEFLLVLPGGGDDVGMEIAERLRRMVASEAFDDVGPGVRITISLGVASEGGAGSAAEGAGDADALVKRADLALYRAKQAGRDRVSR
jgi:diguanylate cyclase (GGDEF)-like protein